MGLPCASIGTCPEGTLGGVVAKKKGKLIALFLGLGVVAVLVAVLLSWRSLLLQYHTYNGWGGSV